MNIALIPARAGSKGVPNKNLVPIWEIPLIGVAALCAKESGLFDKIILSTDSEIYAETGIKYGCEVPYLRDGNLAADKSSINDVILDLINKCQGRDKWNSVSIIEPTCPLRTPEILIKNFNAMYQNSGVLCAFTISEVPVKYNPIKQFFKDDNGTLSHAMETGGTIINRQELKPSFIRNGACYSIRVAEFLKTANYTKGILKGVVVEEQLINIDHPEDIAILREYEKSMAMPSWLEKALILLKGNGFMKS